MVLREGDVQVDRELVKRLLRYDLVGEAEKAPHFWFAWWHRMSTTEKYEYVSRAAKWIEYFVCTECHIVNKHQGLKPCAYGYTQPGEHNWVRLSRWHADQIRKLDVEHVLMGWHLPQSCKHCHRPEHPELYSKRFSSSA